MFDVWSEIYRNADIRPTHLNKPTVLNNKKYRECKMLTLHKVYILL